MRRFFIGLSAALLATFVVAACDMPNAAERDAPSYDLSWLDEFQALPVDYANIVRSCIGAQPDTVFMACVNKQIVETLRLDVRPANRARESRAATVPGMLRPGIHPPDSVFEFPPYRSLRPLQPDRLRTA